MYGRAFSSWIQYFFSSLATNLDNVRSPPVRSKINNNNSPLKYRYYQSSKNETVISMLLILSFLFLRLAMVRKILRRVGPTPVRRRAITNVAVSPASVSLPSLAPLPVRLPYDFPERRLSFYNDILGKILAVGLVALLVQAVMVALIMLLLQVRNGG
ncbi:hypothetical protein OCU04_001467 [Sclerotinia nivalis]|uniref:Uncharacterized protein n=1 Tax=Sclerotinia nivalis TaxID=352851 RepID=A0A9X0AY71_9HELO|nr:hypothetical protein OCU04_001467 [Sclerotinia nivalis]